MYNTFMMHERIYAAQCVQMCIGTTTNKEKKKTLGRDVQSAGPLTRRMVMRVRGKRKRKAGTDLVSSRQEQGGPGHCPHYR